MPSMALAKPLAKSPHEAIRRDKALEEYQAYRRLRADPHITITRHSERGRPIAAPVAQALTLEDELEAEMIAFEIDLHLAQRRAHALIERSALAALVADTAAYAVLTMGFAAAAILAARLGLGV